MLSELLKDQTKSSHQLLEKKIVERIKSISVKNDYAALLQIFYTYFGGLEKKVDDCIDVAAMPDYHRRRKATTLAADLAALGTLPLPLAGKTDLPAITNTLQSLGALYVMEGSILGGPHIIKMITTRLLLPANTGFNFFSGYGNETPGMWQAFKKSLDNLQTPVSGHDRVVQAANDTFMFFSSWVDKH